MTYLELVNAVLKRLRESTVTSVSENSYSALVGEFINDAKRVVEDAWPWRALIDTVTVPLVSGTRTYDLEDYNCDNSGAPARERARVYVDPESGSPLIRITTDNEESYVPVVSSSYDFVYRKQLQNDSDYDKPTAVYMVTNPGNTSGQTNLRLQPYPTPDASYNLELFLVNPQNPLSSGTDVLLVPYDPVIQLAYLYCLYERGEEVGEMLTLTSNKADAALADAIMHDQSMTSEIIFWVP